MNRRVVVTGMGCISPVGQTPEDAWQTVLKGKSGVRKITRFDASAFPAQIAAEVSGFDLSKWVSPEIVPSFAKSGLNIKYGAAAATQAMRHSGLDVSRLADPTRFGVYLGSGEGSQDFLLMMQTVAEATMADGNCDLVRFADLAMNSFDAEFEQNQEPSILAGRLAGMFGALGPNLNTLTACAASAQALGEATELIRQGDADIMLSGGSHSMIHPFGITGFCLLTTLSMRNDDPEKASRPFDRERDGFILGEGAVMLVLEEYEHAKRRGATIHGEILGYGVTADAYRPTDIPPGGEGMSRAINLALKNARLNPDQIHYVNAHGTSTKANDKTETSALKSALESHARAVPISSTKGATGHLVAACGALEAVFSLMALRDQRVPPTANYEFPDPECDLDYIPGQARDVKLQHVMSNNAGFGGQNVSLIFSRL